MDELEKLEKFLEKSGFYLPSKTLSILYSAIHTAIHTLLLRGPAGTGKTELSRLLAEYLDAEYVFYQCTIGTTEEDLVYKLLPSEDTKSGIKIVLGPLPEALMTSKKRKVVLVLDEFDKTRPTADALLLDYLQNCRVSVRIKDEKVITGNPENLVVILTSNDERDFSEPLLRRVVSVYLEPLPPKKVAEILKNKVREDIIPLLVQLYKDTLNARLRKPATIQELQQLGRAIDILGDSADWTTLIRAYIIKDDMDWQKYKEYLELGRDVEEEEEEDITEYYEGYEEHAEEEQETEEEWKPRMPRIKMSRNPEVSKDVKEDYSNQDITVSMYMEHSEDNYDRVIKDFRPEPTDSPVQFADFKVIREGEKTFIIKDKPLKLKDIVENLDIGGEQVIYSVYLKKIVGREVTLYIKDIVSLTDDFIQRFVESFKVAYYTRDLLRFKEGNTDFILSRLGDSKWQLELVHETKTRTDTKNLEKVVLEILRNHPVIRASSEFTRKVEEFIDNIGKQRVSAENSEQAKNIFMASETYRKIVNKVQTIREQVMKKYRVSEVHGTKNIKVQVRYSDRSWYSVDIPVVTFDKEIIMKVIL